MGSYTFSKKINNSLLPITFIYLLIPTILFTTFWTKPTVAIFADLILLFGAFLALWNYTSVCKEKQVSLSPATLFSSFISSLIFTYVSGAGEFINQFYDYLLHNAKFNLLTVDDWPIYNPNRKVYMCYYLGYYLVPSGLGKWFGLDSVKYISFAWLWFGLFLSLLWIHQIFKSFSLLKRTVATFMIWSGAYVAVMIPVLEKLFDKPSFLGSNSVFIGRGEMMLHYSSILKSVVEGPQHAITAILGGAVFMALGCTSASVGIFSLFTIGSLFWSPFVSIGLAPFTLYTYYLYVTERGFIAFMRKQVPMLVMMLIGFLPLVLYTLGSSATQMDSNRFFTHTTASYPILLYGLFIVVSAGIWILFFRKRLFELDAAMVCISYGTLSVLALFQIGYFNDLNNRASVPALFIIGISIIHLILKSSFNRPVNYLLLAGLAFWLLNTASIFTYLYQTFITVNKAPENTISNPYNRHTNNDYYDYMKILYPMNSQEVIKQYSLNPESIFQKYLLRKSENDN